MAPIAMLNGLWFDPDGGAQRYYSGYGPAVAPILAEVGADVIFPFLELDQALEGGFDPSVFGLVRDPSAEAFDEMWASERYGEVAPLRAGALEKAVLTRCAIEPHDAGPPELMPGVVVLNLLWLRPGGRERYDEYLTAVAPVVEGIGGRLLSPRFVPDRAVEGDLLPDLLFIGNYPSLDAVMEMTASDAYRGPAELREAAVERSMTTTLRVP